MKTIRVSALFVLLAAVAAGPVRAGGGEAAAPPRPRPKAALFLRYGSFLPAAETFKDVYGPGPVYGAEARVRVIGGLHLSVGLEFFKDTGRLTVTQDETQLKITPMEAMAVYHILPGNIMPYVGAGLRLAPYEESNVMGTVKGSGLGWVACAGVAARWRFLGLDARLRYSSVKDTPLKKEADFSGLTADLGLGVFF